MINCIWWGYSTYKYTLEDIAIWIFDTWSKYEIMYVEMFCVPDGKMWVSNPQLDEMTWSHSGGFAGASYHETIH